MIIKPILAKKYAKLSGILIAVFAIHSGYANPTGGTVTAGQAQIENAGDKTTITQTSDKAIIHWDSFNIAAHETTHFQQPVGGIALNHINANQGVSKIYGTLTATGKIILENSAGFHFGPSAYVNVGGLIATATASISDKNFMAGNYIFDQSNKTGGDIINEGDIRAADYGLVALIGENVINKGVITAKLGHVVLASGDHFVISTNDLYGFALTTTVEKPNKGVTNTGKITADGGFVEMQAGSMSQTLNNVINVDGIVEVRSVSEHNGEILISGMDPDENKDRYATVNIQGKIDVSGKEAGLEGGDILIGSYQVNILNNTFIDLSGDKRGGNMYAGGLVVNVNPNVGIQASAITNGNGGFVGFEGGYVYIDGVIFATGGANGGNGGNIIANAVLDQRFTKLTNVGAPNGNPGLAMVISTEIGTWVEPFLKR